MLNSTKTEKMLKHKRQRSLKTITEIKKKKSENRIKKNRDYGYTFLQRSCLSKKKRKKKAHQTKYEEVWNKELTGSDQFSSMV